MNNKQNNKSQNQDRGKPQRYSKMDTQVCPKSNHPFSDFPHNQFMPVCRHRNPFIFWRYRLSKWEYGSVWHFYFCVNYFDDMCDYYKCAEMGKQNCRADNSTSIRW